MTKNALSCKKWQESNIERFKASKKKHKLDHKDDKLVKLQRKAQNAKYYQKKKAEKLKNEALTKSLYNTRNSLIKAVGKVKKNLPKSKEKSIEVIQELSKSIPIHHSENVPKIQSQARQQATEYFLKDCVSTTLPGKKDVKTFIVNGEKVVMNVRVLHGSLNEHFQDFKNLNPQTTIGRTTFIECLPPNVKHFKHMPLFSCLCKYHENVRFLFNSLKPFLLDTSISSLSILLDRIVCSSADVKCMTNSCDTCNNVQEIIESHYVTNILDQHVTFTQWDLKDQKPSKISRTEKFSSVIRIFTDQISQFKTHAFIHNIQSKNFESDCKKFKPDEAIALFDFSERFLNEGQNEIQQAYFKRESWSVFTFAVYVPDHETQSMKCISGVVISDEHKQDKFSVFAFKKAIIDFILTEYPHIKVLTIWSDGASSQFKNIFTISNIMFFKWRYDIKIIWKFHATSHGKCVVDGIGGCVKNVVSRRVKSQNITLNSAYDFYETALKFCTKIKIFFVAESEILGYKSMLSAYFNRFKSNPIKQFRSFHYFEAIGDNAIRSCLTHLGDDELVTTIPMFVPPGNEMKFHKE